MTELSIKNISFLICSCTLFFLEILFFGFMQQHSMYLLLLFLITILLDGYQKRVIAVLFFLLCVLAYLDTNMFGSNFTYLSISTITAWYLDEQLRIKIVIPFFVLWTTLLCKIVSDGYLFNIEYGWKKIIIIIMMNSCILAFFLLIKQLIEKNKP